MNNISFPQTSPKALYLLYKNEIDDAIANVPDREWYILGYEVSDFEQEFVRYIGVTDTIGAAKNSIK